MLYGSIVNALAIIVGTMVGLFCKRYFNKRLTTNLIFGLGLCTTTLGIKMALEFQNVLIMIGCIATGCIIGTALSLEKKMETLAERIQAKMFKKKGDDFAKGFTLCSIIFCAGSMAVVGSIKSGIANDHSVLLAKGFIDGVMCISFGSVYGIGVAFSSLPVLIYQGSITLVSSQITDLTHPNVIGDISGVGGVLLMMVGMKVCGLKKIPVGDYLPAMVIVILASLGLHWMN